MVSALRHTLLTRSKNLVPSAKALAHAMGRWTALERSGLPFHPTAVSGRLPPTDQSTASSPFAAQSIEKHQFSSMIDLLNERHLYKAQKFSEPPIASTSDRQPEEMLNMASLLALSLYSHAAISPADGTSTFLHQMKKSSPFPAFVNDMQSLNVYMEQFFIEEDNETVESWTRRLPTYDELNEAHELVEYLYTMNSFEGCSPKLLHEFPSLAKSMNLTFFKNEYCILHEQIPARIPYQFPRGFGYLVLASPRVARRGLHHSVAHFQSDGKVCEQAAVLFEKTQSRSLVVAGASRFAIKHTHPKYRHGKPLTPAQQSKCQKGFTKSDAAHNANLMFHHMNIALRDVSLRAKEDATFIQWHGMAETSCGPSQVFVSAGGPSDYDVYNRNSKPVKVASALNSIGHGMSACTPKTNNACKLYGGSNPFGRYINGVPSQKACSQPATNEATQGDFVHIEQKYAARHALNTWQQVLESVFPAEAENDKQIYGNTNNTVQRAQRL